MAWDRVFRMSKARRAAVSQQAGALPVGVHDLVAQDGLDQVIGRGDHDRHAAVERVHRACLCVHDVDGGQVVVA